MGGFKVQTSKLPRLYTFNRSLIIRQVGEDHLKESDLKMRELTLQEIEQVLKAPAKKNTKTQKMRQALSDWVKSKSKAGSFSSVELGYGEKGVPVNGSKQIFRTVFKGYPGEIRSLYSGVEDGRAQEVSLVKN